MSQVTHLKHNIHKFHDIKPKLGRDNWISWKRELLATTRDRGLYTNILNTDKKPLVTDPQITMTNNIAHINSIPLTQLIDEWTNRKNSAYNQLLLCISPEPQTAIDATDLANIAWTLLTKKFKSTDPSKISIVRMKYDNYHMLEGQYVVSYLTVMKEFKTQLEKMGKTITTSTHAATTLRNLLGAYMYHTLDTSLIYFKTCSNRPSSYQNIQNYSKIFFLIFLYFYSHLFERSTIFLPYI